MNDRDNGYVPPLERLAENFRRLPGIGKKSAYRLAFFMLDLPNEDAAEFVEAILDAKRKMRRCSVCQNISDRDICSLCTDARRNKKLICIVEDPRDVAAIERIHEFEGSFHVLHGVISPLDGKGPDKLTIKELLLRLDVQLKDTPASEIELILATNPNVEGEATAMYLARLIKPLGIKVSRLAYGIPVGGDLEYADDVTLFRAIEGRREM
jgi:recombination protein RecR